MNAASTKPVYICSPKRTAIGSFMGVLSTKSAVELGTAVVKDILSVLQLLPEQIDEVIFGCVLSAGVGQAPARQVAIRSGLPNSVQAMTVNKVCSSGLKAVMLAANSIKLGHAEAVIAGGMESMSQAPFVLPALRAGARLGNSEAIDLIIHDGLWDVYNNFHMGNAAELCAKKFSLTREAQDAFAIESYKRAQKAIEAGVFESEITSVAVQDGKAEKVIRVDEEPGRAKLEKIPSLKPAFDKNGTVTAANASSINDGAAAMLVCSEEFLKQAKLTPDAMILEQGWAAREPEWFTIAPVDAVRHVLQRAGKDINAVDLFELNEAFSAVALACSAELQIPAEKVNIYGGAVALGHPIGASGARILTTLIHALRRNKLRTGVASLCNGGGEATALMVEVC